MLKFEVYQGGEASTLEDLGTVKMNAGVGGSYKPASASNLANLDKRVAIVIKNKKGESVVVPCSKRVSAALRAKELTLTQLGDLHVLSGTFTNAEDEEIEGSFISFTGSTMPEVTVTDIKETEVKLTEKAINDLIAF